MSAPTRLRSLVARLAGARNGDVALPVGSLGQFIELAPDAMLGVDQAGVIRFANSQARRLFGYPEGELPGTGIEQLVPERLRRDHAAMRESYTADPVARPMGAGLDLTAQRKDGTFFPCEISLGPIDTGDGMILMAVVRDMTERRRAQTESDALKSEFFALVSHELRTPLTSILGYAELIAERDEENLTETGAEFIRVIQRNAQRLDRLVQDLLLVAQVEAGRFGIVPGPVDIDALIRSKIEDLSLAAKEQGVELIYRPPAEPVPPFSADRSRLGQVLDNLISNAIKFTPAGGRVTTGVSAREGECTIEVSDTGEGIEPEAMENLFARFFRGAAASSAHIKGVGLGLAITKTIVEGHRGEIEVESEPGEGTTFRVRLPMERVEP